MGQNTVPLLTAIKEEIRSIGKVIDNVFPDGCIGEPCENKKQENGDIIYREDPESPANYKVLYEVELLISLVMDFFPVFKKYPGDQESAQNKKGVDPDFPVGKCIQDMILRQPVMDNHQHYCYGPDRIEFLDIFHREERLKVIIIRLIKGLNGNPNKRLGCIPG